MLNFGHLKPQSSHQHEQNSKEHWEHGTKGNPAEPCRGALPKSETVSSAFPMVVTKFHRSNLRKEGFVLNQFGDAYSTAEMDIT